MRENQLFTALRALVAATLSPRVGGATLGLALAYQPTQQGTPTTRALRMHTVSTRRYGWRKSEAVPQVDGTLRNGERVQLETILQMTVVGDEAATAPSALTAMDVAQALASAMQSDRFIASAREWGFSVLRVDNVRSSRFVGDTGQFINWPSFDVTIVHHDEFLDGLPVVSAFDFEAIAIPEII